MKRPAAHRPSPGHRHRGRCPDGHQPSWPLQVTVAGVYRAGEYDETADGDVAWDSKAVVYIVEGQRPDASPCAPEAAWAEMTT